MLRFLLKHSMGFVFPHNSGILLGLQTRTPVVAGPHRQAAGLVSHGDASSVCYLKRFLLAAQEVLSTPTTMVATTSILIPNPELISNCSSSVVHEV